MRGATTNAGKSGESPGPLMNYPESYREIEDPSPRLPAELARQIALTIPRTVVRLRKEDNETGRLTVLANAAVEIFEVLAPRRSEETYADVESLRRALKEDADIALAFVHYIYKSAGPEYGRMLWLWHAEIQKRLHFSEKRSSIETEWWERHADANPASPVVSPPVPTKAPRTPTASRIEKFIDDVYQATGVKIDKMDIWLAAGYHSDKEFRLFQAEKKVAPAQKFNRVLRKTPEEFIRNLKVNREAHAAHLKAKPTR
jgi:hypothetical protein